MPKKKNDSNVIYLEPTGNEGIPSGMLPVVDGPIGVKHTEESKAEEEKQVYPLVEP